MSGDVAAVILAAGEGRRLRPLTDRLPKALCPVGNTALLDLALERVAGFGLAAETWNLRIAARVVGPTVP